MMAKRAIAVLGAAALSLALGATAVNAEQATGADELYRRGVEAFDAGRYADAASMFRLSYGMQPRAATQCNLAQTYERWGGHDRDALAAYERCAAEDHDGRYRRHALERSAALRLRLASAAVGSAPAAPPPAIAPPNTAAPGGLPIRIVWSGIQRTSGCFFFSGPGRLGRNDQLADAALWSSAGGRATLTFAGGQVFAGARQGQNVELTRRTTYDSSGRWVVTETLRGVFDGDVLRATYHYDECNAARPASCPGHCHIDAQLTARPR